MEKPKMWRTFEELNADHERLVAEVEALKKDFEAHVHKYLAPMFGTPTLTGKKE